MTFQDVHPRYDDVHTAFIDVRTVLGDVRWVLLPEKYCSHKASVARNCPSASYSNSGPRGGIVIYTRAGQRMLQQETTKRLLPGTLYILEVIEVLDIKHLYEAGPEDTSIAPATSKRLLHSSLTCRYIAST